MTGTALVSAIVEILVSGITGVASGLGQGIGQIVESLVFYTPEGGTTGLSVFAVLVIAFAGISLALGLFRLIYQLFTSFGARNR